MKRSSLGFLFLFLAVSSHALDNERLVRHLRESLGLDTRTEVKVLSGPAASDVVGMKLIQVSIGGGAYPIYMSNDESKYFWGQLMDFKVSPDADRSSRFSENTGHAQGSKAAPVTLVEFSDLQCPYCANAHKILKQELYKNYTKDQVRHVYKHYPLNMHLWAENAAIATECGAQQKESAFWGMLDSFFDASSSISTGTVRARSLEFAKKQGLDAQKFEQCLDSQAMRELIEKNKAEGMAVGVNSTPTIFINGRPRKGFRDFSDLKVVIDEKLKEKKK